MQELGFHILNLGTWIKPNAAPNLGCRQFTHSTEGLIWAAPFESKPLAHHFDYESLKAKNGGKQMRDYWPIPVVPKREKIHGSHTTQKPEALLELVIRASAPDGALVLDPFAGSSTTGVVALRHGCRYIGIDMDENYLDLSRRRLDAEIAKGIP